MALDKLFCTVSFDFSWSQSFELPEVPNFCYLICLVHEDWVGARAWLPPLSLELVFPAWETIQKDRRIILLSLVPYYISIHSFTAAFSPSSYRLNGSLPWLALLCFALPWLDWLCLWLRLRGSMSPTSSIELGWGICIESTDKAKALEYLVVAGTPVLSQVF